MAEQAQTVTVIRSADRHADLHQRNFAATLEVTVPSGTLAEVLAAAVADLPDLPPGRYAVTVDWPHD